MVSFRFSIGFPGVDRMVLSVLDNVAHLNNLHLGLQKPISLQFMLSLHHDNFGPEVKHGFSLPVSFGICVLPEIPILEGNYDTK